MLSLGLGLGITKQPRTGFTPASLNPELFVDVSDTSTLFQDAAGTTPVTSAGDPVRLVLDKSQGLARGEDLWDTGDVSVGAIWTESGGVWTKGSTGFATLGLATLQPNTWYEWTFTITATAGVLNVWRRNQTDTGNEQAASSLGSGGHTVRVRSGPAANGEGHHLWFDGSAFTGTVSNLSIRELPGNHLTAPSDAARPTYQTDGTYHWLEFDGVDDYVEAATRFGFSANPAMLVTAGLRPSTYGESVERIWHLGDNVNGSISGALGSSGLSWRHNNGFRSFPVVAEGSDYVVSHSRQSGDNYNQQLCFLDGVSQVEVSSIGGFPVDTAAKFVVASNGTGNILGMRLYSLVVMGGHADGQRVQLEKWSAQKAGVTL